MKKYFDTVANANGSPVSGALVTVLNFGTATPSTIFSDAAGTVSLANPVTTNSRGFFEFYAADGRYSLSITGAGFPAVSVTDILLDDPADANTVVINGGSVNDTPIGATTPSTGAFTTVTASGNVVVTGTVTGTSFTGAGTGLTGTASALSIGGNAASLTTARTIGGSSFDGTANVTSFPVPGPIGGTTPSTGAFTTLSAAGNVTLGDATTDTLNVGNGGLIKDAAGNVGIGVTPSAWGVGYRAVQLANGSAVWNPFHGTGVALGANAYQDNSGYRYIGTEAFASMYLQQSGGHFFRSATGGTAGAPITFTQSLSVGLGTTLALEGATSAAGTGIAFPATQFASSNPNTLDDYEEGTWTPNQGAGLTVVGAFSSSGTYTKIGRQVTVQGQISGATSVAIAAGGTMSTNLPFTVGANSGVGSSMSTTAVLNGSVIALSGTSTIYGSAISATPSIGFTCTYFV